MNHKRTLVLSALLAAVPMVLAAPAASADPISTTIIAQSGDASPDGSGELYGFEAPSLNDEGQAAFNAFIFTPTGISNYAVFRGDETSLALISRAGQSTPDGNGTFETFGQPAINKSGQVDFLGYVTGSSTGTGEDRGVFRGNGTTLTPIARTGQAAPDGNGTFNGQFDDQPALNDAGQVAFKGRFDGTSGGLADDRGIFRGAGGALTTIVRKGQTVPGDATSTFQSFSTPQINQSGQVAFYADLAGSGTHNQGVYRGDGSTITQIVRKDDAVPGSSGTRFTGFSSPVINDSGQVLFKAFTLDDAPGAVGQDAIFRADGITLTQIAHNGQAAPDGNGTFSFLAANPDFNNAGQAVFNVQLNGTAGGSADNHAIIRSDGTTLTQIARTGQAAPDGNGTFGFLTFSAPEINNAGQVVFHVELTGTANGNLDNDALYFYDDTLGLQKVVRTGDDLLGSKITQIGYYDHFVYSNERRRINNLSQVAYSFLLADGRSGVAITTFDTGSTPPPPPPPPTSVPVPAALWCGLAGMLCLGLRRRSRAIR